MVGEPPTRGVVSHAITHDPGNHLLQYAMASNISGVIGSAVAAGVLISFLG